MTKKITITTPKERMAPGHVYIEALGTGIQWFPKTATLWEQGRPVATASHTTDSAFEFFFNLEFARSFRDVSHWWFRSAWTQRVRLTGIQGTMDAATVWGWMQFIDESVPARQWSATSIDASVSEIAVPYPPNEVQPVNLPLRLALSRLVAGVITDQVARDEWLVITSLVHRDDLEKVFTTESDALPWRLEGMTNSLRRELCILQGLKGK